MVADNLFARERLGSTGLGHGVAIPHGQHESLGEVYRTGISVLQLPAGVEIPQLAQGHDYDQPIANVHKA